MTIENITQSATATRISRKMFFPLIHNPVLRYRNYTVGTRNTRLQDTKNTKTCEWSAVYELRKGYSTKKRTHTRTCIWSCISYSIILVFYLETLQEIICKTRVSLLASLGHGMLIGKFSGYNSSDFITKLISKMISFPFWWREKERGHVPEIIH